MLYKKSIEKLTVVSPTTSPTTVPTSSPTSTPTGISYAEYLSLIQAMLRQIVSAENFKIKSRSLGCC